MNSIETITIIGAGSIGSAIATKAIDSNISVSFFNRTLPSKNEIVGADYTNDINIALEKRNIVFICLFHYESILKVIKKLNDTSILKHKVFVCVTSMSIEQSKKLHNYLSKHNAHLIDVAVISHANSIIENKGAAFLSGDKKILDMHNKTLNIFFPYAKRVDKYKWAASALEMAYGSYLFLVSAGMGMSLAILKSCDLDLKVLPDFLEQSNFNETLSQVYMYMSHKSNEESYEEEPILWSIGNQKKTLELIENQVNKLSIRADFLNVYSEYISGLSEASDFSKIIDKFSS